MTLDLLRDAVAALPQPDRRRALRLLDAVAWLAAALGPVSDPDPAARQRAVDALYAAWTSRPDHRDALTEASAALRAAGASTAPHADMLDALAAALALPPRDADLGAALQPALHRLAALEQAARDAAVAAQVRSSLDARFANFKLPFQGIRRP